jgi:hypothetical protein
MTQMDFNFSASGEPVGTPCATAQLDRSHLHPSSSAEKSAGGDCSVSVCEGSSHRAWFIRETEHSRCQIRFLNDRLVQTLNRQVVTRDDEL